MTDTIQQQQVVPAQNASFLPILYTYRKVLLVGASVGLGIGLVFALMKPTTFTATATLLFPSAPASGLAALTGGGGGGDIAGIPLLDGAVVLPRPGSSAATAQRLLQTRRARKDVLRQLERQGLDLQRAWDIDSEEDILDKLSDGMQISPGKAGELTVGFRDTDSKRALTIARVMVTELEMLPAALGLEPTERSITFLESQLTEAEASYQQSQRALQDFQQQHLIVSLPDQARALADRYARLQAEAAGAKLEADVAMRQVDLMSEQAQQLIDACVDPGQGVGTLATLYKSVTQAESELALLRSRMTDEHPDVQAKKQALAEAQRLLKEEIRRQSRIVKNGSAPAINTAVVQAAVNQAKSTGLVAALAQAKADVAKLPVQQATYMQLSATLEADLAAVKLFRMELQKARIVAESSNSRFIVIDPVEYAKRDAGGRLPIIALALFFGVGCAMFFPYREWFRRQLAVGSIYAPAVDTDR